MTEDAWLTLTRPCRLLTHVAPVATERKLRLLAVACHRWSFPFAGEESEAVLRAVERVADGIETSGDVAVLDSLRDWDRRSWNRVVREAITAVGICDELPRHRSNLDERVAQCDLIRDIFGNSFRSAILDPAVQTSTVLALARQMYDTRDFSAMPILADALQDAGCDHDDILGHCRGSGPHVRGCWVVDLLLGMA
jgi:hypothetical protein